MGSSTQHLSFNVYIINIQSPELKNLAVKALVEIMTDSDDDAASRVVHIFSTFKFENRYEVLTDLIDKKEKDLRRMINSTLPVPVLMRHLDYVCELNRAIARLSLTNNKTFLLKQLQMATKPLPLPPSNEFFIHELSIKSAFEALKSLDPDLAKLHEHLIYDQEATC